MTTLLNVAQLAHAQPAFTEASIRWLIFNAETNGLEASGALSRLGRRVFLDEVKFVEWVKSNPKLDSK